MIFQKGIYRLKAEGPTEIGRASVTLAIDETQARLIADFAFSPTPLEIKLIRNSDPLFLSTMSGLFSVARIDDGIFLFVGIDEAIVSLIVEFGWVRFKQVVGQINEDFGLLELVIDPSSAYVGLDFQTGAGIR